MSALPQTAPHRRPAPDARTRRPPPPLRLVPPRPRASWVAIMISLVVVGVLGVVGLQAQAAGAAFEARELEQQVTDLERQHEQLTAEVAELQAPERLRRIAVNDLGMVPAEDRSYLDLSQPGKLAAVPGDEVADPVKHARTGR